MTRQLNDHQLRLVTVDDIPESSEPTFVSDWPLLCESFSTATGLPLTFRAADEEAPVAPVTWSIEVPAVGNYAPGTLSLLKKKTRMAPKRVEATEALAKQVGGLVEQLHAAERSLWQREAELMTAIPVVVRPDDEPNQLAARFEAILKCGAEALRCDAAAIYLLDDDTRHLKMRSHFGLKHSRLTAPPRELQTARADVEALAGYAITLKSASELQEWNVPEPFESAVCVPIATANVPLGTLWFFSNEEQEYGDELVNLAEIFAGRIAVECEREILLREQQVVGTKGLRIEKAVDRQQENLPGALTNAERWQVAARPTSRSRLHGDYYHWNLDSENRTDITLTTSCDVGVPAALAAATMSGVLQAASRLSAEMGPVERLEKLNDALMATSMGDQHASVATARLDSEGGSVEVVTAGEAAAFVIRPHGWERLADSPVAAAGMLEDPELPAVTTSEMQDGDLLFLLTAKPRRQPRIARDEESARIDANHYAETLLHYMHLSVEEMTTVLASLWEPGQSEWEMPPAVMIAKYRDA